MIKLNHQMCRYTPDIGEVPDGEIVLCGVCGDPMNEKRNVTAARGFFQGVTGTKTLHDVFVCGNIEKDWHCQVLALMKKSKDTPSAKLAQIYFEEANEILKNRTSTKDNWNKFE